LPEKLAPKIRCVLTMIEDSACHRNLLKRESKPQQIPVAQLQRPDRQVSPSLTVVGHATEITFWDAFSGADLGMFYMFNGTWAHTLRAARK